MQKIRCVVERITYQNPENGYSVLKCRVKDYSELVPVIGNMIDANVGSVLVCEGNWKVDAKYGRQFVAENWEDFREYVAASSLEDKEEILKIVDSDRAADDKEALIKRQFPRAWAKLRAECLPFLRRTDYRIDYEIIDND